MKRFDVLDPTTPITGHHFLEASAGTGKTFAIEHLTMRLIKEEGLSLEEILIVTFTRAATRELKTRIHQILQKGSVLAPFDQAQIFTIHGFCSRMLTEYAFEAGREFVLFDADKPTSYHQLLRAHITDFLRTSLPPEEYSTSQLATLMRKHNNNKDVLMQKLLSITEKGGSYPLYPDFTTSYKSYLKRHFQAPLNQATIFNKICDSSGEIKQPWKTQLDLLAKPHLSLEEFDSLIASEKQLLSLFTEENLSKTTTIDPTPLYAFREALLPTLEEASSPLCSLVRIGRACSHTIQTSLTENGSRVLLPDEILKKMADALELPLFLSKVRGRYRAAIIDEFQDTDALQWHVFKTLFLDPPIPTLYLVGDPKQSIYSFRDADIYIYLNAKSSFVKNIYHLDTNYRSDPSLITELNALFSQKGDWLSLPQISLPFHPVKHPNIEDTSFPDGKSPLHFFIYETEKKREKNWPSPEIETTTFFPFIANEIHTLTRHGFHFSDFAILVKDRYQGGRLKCFLEHQAIPTRSKNIQPLAKTPSYTLIEYLLQAYLDPTEISIKRFLSHPLHSYSHHDLQDETLIAKHIAILRTVPNLHAVFHNNLFIPQDLETYSDLITLTEHILQTPDHPLQALENLSDRPRRPLSDPNSVIITTIHMSKGLEFNIVFALGLINRYTNREALIRYQREYFPLDLNHSRCQAALENQESEKMRQLYVALTRAKKRLYVPLLVDTGNTPIPPGQASPLELFNPCPQSATYLTPHHLPPRAHTPPTLHPPKNASRHFTTHTLYSYSSLARSMTISHPSPATLDTDLPRGPDTGLLLHTLLEAIFRDALPDEAIPHLLRAQLPSHLPPDPIRSIIYHALHTPLHPHTFALRDISSDNLHPEVEFLYPIDGDYIMGSIDLIFFYKDKAYILDWKTTLLADYSQATLQAAMHYHDYTLQAQLYNTALSRYLSPSSIAGTYYIFLRGLPQAGILFLPSKDSSISPIIPLHNSTRCNKSLS